MKFFHHAAASAIFLAFLLGSPAVWAAEKAAGHISLVPSELKWTDAPGIGPGVQIAMIEGNLKVAGPVTFRIKLPPKAKIPTHTHPLIEHVTVISGTFYLGIGDKYDEAKARAYPAGGITVIPQGMPMFAFVKEKGAVIQVHGIGPWGISYLNPAEAPGAKKK